MRTDYLVQSHNYKCVVRYLLMKLLVVVQQDNIDILTNIAKATTPFTYTVNGNYSTHNKNKQSCMYHWITLMKPKITKYNWIEIMPMLVILVVSIVFLALFPSCSDNGNCVQHVVRQDFDMDRLEKAVLNNTDFLQRP